MGNYNCKCTRGGGAVIEEGMPLTQRENMATWLRSDIPLTDVYDIEETLGQGHMGEVYKVKRKVENRGLHNAETREKSEKVVEVPLDVMIEMDHSSHRSINGSIHSSARSTKSNPFNRRKKSIKKRNQEILKSVNKEKYSGKEHSSSSLGASDLNLPSTPTTKPKSILKNPLDIAPEELQRLAKLNLDSDYMNNDDDIPPLGMKKNGSYKNLKDAAGSTDTSSDTDTKSTPTFQHKDSRLLHPTFSPISDCFEPSESYDDISQGEGVLVGGSDNGSSDNADAESSDEKKKKWVPRRKIRFQRIYACKTIGTEKIKEDQLHELLNEIYMMRKMDHPYIIRLYEVYQVKRKIWLVMDLCTGGNLTTRKLGEPQVAVVAEQILRALAYMHRRGICHRDLKMENILYENTADDSSIRLIDFGLSQTYNESDKKQMGAAYTMSPEIASQSGEYTEKSDVWSIGVIVWILLAGDYPFMKTNDDLSNESKKQHLINAQYEFGITWRGRGISYEAKRFVIGCLKKNPDERWSAIEALEYLQDEWVPKLEEKGALEVEQETKRLAALPKKDSPKRRVQELKVKDRCAVLTKTHASKMKKSEMVLDHDIMEDLVKYTEYGFLKKTALIALANTMDRKDVGKLSEIFLMVDTEQTGTISPDEFKQVLVKLNIPDLSDDRILEIFNGIDHDRSGQIHFAEFLAALVEGEGLVTKERLADAFDRIDHEGKGYISHENLKKILGENYSKDTVDRMIEEGDFKKNGRVEFDEFAHLFYEDEKIEMSEENESSLRSLTDLEVSEDNEGGSTSSDKNT